jgi:3',5'-cyclic-AMP phosphodiesterase
MSHAAVTFVWPGDLHLDHAGRDNHSTALWMADEVSNLIRPDFVQFAGDNVQHARESEWALFAEVTSRLTVPWYALVGDHDAHHDPGCLSFQANVGEPYRAFTLGGFRFIALNTMQSKPLGMSQAQVLWFRYEVDLAISRGERVVVFQHHYPFQIWEDFGVAPGMAAWREIVQTRPIVGVFAGHTHYGQMANDGRNVYVATRSIGEPEGGAAGYSIVTLDANTLAVTYRTMDETGPVVQITAPRRAILATSSAHIVTGPSEVRARVWSRAAVSAVDARVDENGWLPCVLGRDGQWSAPLAVGGFAKGVHRLEVRALDTSGETGHEVLAFHVDLTGRFNPMPGVDPTVDATRFC